MSGALDSTAWVAAGYSAEIPPFTTCVIDATTGKVVPFDNGSHSSADVRLTMDYIYDIDTTGDQLCSLFDQVILKYGIVNETSAVTWSAVQRIEIRPEEV